MSDPLKPYDGIVELDNVLPPWWLGIFYVTIVFAMVYVLGYHLFKVFNLQDAEYKAETIALEKSIASTAQKNQIQSTVAAAAQTVDLEAGKLIYSKNCSSCHGPAGEGGIGPSFKDSTWIHGGDLASIQKIIREGVLAKGMLAWGNLLRPKEIEDVSQYVKSLEGK